MRIVPFRPWIAKENVTQNLLKFTTHLQDHFSDNKTKKLFQVASQPCLLLHQIREGDRCFRGIICLTDLRFRPGEKIFPHEATLVSKEREIRKRIEKNQAMLKPVLLTHKPIEHLNVFLDDLQRRQPLVKYNVQGEIVHRFWQIISKKEIEKVCTSFDPLKDIFLADGHHRYASTLKLLPGQFQDPPYLMTTYFDFDNLLILPYHRILLNALKVCPDLEDRLSKISNLHPTREAVLPRETHEITVVIGRRSFKLKWKTHVLDTINKSDKNDLDTHILNRLVFEDIFGIADSRTSRQIKYVDGRTDLDQFCMRVRKSKGAAGFFLHPVPGPKFVKLCKKGQMLPPKSTWFEPRILKGLIVHKF